jgi:hypothetical protein
MLCAMQDDKLEMALRVEAGLAMKDMLASISETHAIPGIERIAEDLDKISHVSHLSDTVHSIKRCLYGP